MIRDSVENDYFDEFNIFHYIIKSYNNNLIRLKKNNQVKSLSLLTLHVFYVLGNKIAGEESGTNKHFNIKDYQKKDHLYSTYPRSFIVFKSSVWVGYMGAWK